MPAAPRGARAGTTDAGAADAAAAAVPGGALAAERARRVAAGPQVAAKAAYKAFTSNRNGDCVRDPVMAVQEMSMAHEHS